MLIKLGRGRFYFYSNNARNREPTSQNEIEKALREFSKWFETLPPRDYVDAKNLGYYPVNLSLWNIYSTEGPSKRFLQERDSENMKQ